MASQHPDHAGKPYWHDKEFISVQEETKECYLTYSDLGIPEYKWDWEGKLVDESVIERLYENYFEYFQKNPLGKEKFLTFRLPNPKVETEFRIGRSFMGILCASSLAKQVGQHSPPIFEVILPMTESFEEMINIQIAFKELSSLKHSLYKLDSQDLKNLEIIPLFEQVNTIINSDKIVRNYLDVYSKLLNTKIDYLRPYVARSDPALNSGIVPTVLAIKIALSRYKRLENDYSVKLYPIIGSASLPFRGGISPYTVENFCNEYKGIKTALIQSAFRYDYPKKDVKIAIKQLEKLITKNSFEEIPKNDEEDLIEILPSFENYYKKSVENLAPLINEVAKHLPKRRERVQHVGLFGYSRGVGKVKLPRAIGFTGSLYSIGLPPELIGTGRGLKKIKNKKLLEKYYLNIKSDLERSGRFVNTEIIESLPSNLKDDVKEIEKYLGHELSPVTTEEKEHGKLTSKIFSGIKSGKKVDGYIKEAALLRKSLG